MLYGRYESKGWFSRVVFTVSDESGEITRCDLPARLRGELTLVIDAEPYKLVRSFWGRYVLKHGEQVLASAEERFFSWKNFLVRVGNLEYALRRASFFRRRWVLASGDRPVGSVIMTSSKLTATLPSDLSLPLRVFVLLVVAWDGHLASSHSASF